MNNNNLPLPSNPDARRIAACLKAFEGFDLIDIEAMLSSPAKSCALADFLAQLKSGQPADAGLPASAADLKVDDLPPLPEPLIYEGDASPLYDAPTGFMAGQMHAYALTAIAERLAKLEGVFVAKDELAAMLDKARRDGNCAGFADTLHLFEGSTRMGIANMMAHSWQIVAIEMRCLGWDNKPSKTIERVEATKIPTGKGSPSSGLSQVIRNHIPSKGEDY